MMRRREDTAEAALLTRVGPLLAAAAAPPEPGRLPGEAEAVAAFRAARTMTTAGRLTSRVTPLRATITAGAATGVLLTGVFAAAATGTLPEPAQDVARDVLARVGVTVPGPDAVSPPHPESRSRPNPASADTAVAPDLRADRQASRSIPDQAAENAPDTVPVGPAAPPADPPSDAGRGEELSDLAQSTGSAGVGKGAEVSGAASGGQSQAGAHGSAADAPRSSPSPGAGGGYAGSGAAGGAGSGEAGHQRVGPRGVAQTHDAGRAGKPRAAPGSSGRNGAGSGRRP